MAGSGSVVRGVAGAFGGAIGGVVVALVASEMLGNVVMNMSGTDNAVGVGLMSAMIGVPLGLVVGAVVGARSAVGVSSPLSFSRRATVLAALVVILLIVVFVPFGHRANLDASGCEIAARGRELHKSMEITVYDRRCSDTSAVTVNVSITKIGSRLGGPGNVFAQAVGGSFDPTSKPRSDYVLASVSDSLQLTIAYDPHWPIVSQSSHVGKYEVEFRPVSGLAH